MSKHITELKEKIRIVNDFPKPGISFKDITPLLSDPSSFNKTLDAFEDFYKEHGITKVCGIESRGFIFGSALSNRLDAGFVPIRKAGKLPYETVTKEYDLEYGTDVIEVHKDAICEDDVILIHDDLLATGGTMQAAIELIQKFKPKAVYISFIIELSALEGKSKLNVDSENIHSLIVY